MKLFYLFFLSIFFFFSQTAYADFTVSAAPAPVVCTINATLRVGSTGAQVACLQAYLDGGLVVDGKFGPKTEVAVKSWQTGHPPLVSDGIFGSKSNAVRLTTLAQISAYPAGCTSSAGYSATTGIKCDSSASSAINNLQLPKVFSVSPEKVRSGDTVKIYGENFSLTGNTVRLRYAQIEDRFENLPSSDGKVISFVFQPPDVKTMTREELLNLPSDISKKIFDPLQAAGGSIDDLLAPYRNMRNEDDLRQFLSSNGHNFDELYDKFWVTVENIHGRGSSHAAILTGLRKLSLGSSSALSKDNIIFSIFHSLSDIFTPKKAYAQTPEGGYNSGFIFYCTCGSGYMTYMTDFSNNGGTGDYYWAPGFVPTVGNPLISGFQLGFFTQNAGSCVIIFGNSCSTITANIANLPWGEAL